MTCARCGLDVGTMQRDDGRVLCGPCWREADPCADGHAWHERVGPGGLDYYSCNRCGAYHNPYQEIQTEY